MNKLPAFFLPKIGKNLMKGLSWLLTVLVLSISLYQFSNTRELEDQLKQTEQRINSAQKELDKAQGYIESMENDLKIYEAKDTEVNIEIDTLIGKWKGDLERMKAVFSGQ